MIDYGKFDTALLEKKNSKSIDGIRFCFQKKDALNIIPFCNQIISKGYDLYIQPMITARYSESELIELINLVNSKLPAAKGFYIVDSFGEMRYRDVLKLVKLADKYLNKNISIGFHSHNNLQLSYSNAIALIEEEIERELILDGSIMGMGKGAGNLNTELLMEHLNIFTGSKYSVEPLLETIDKVLKPIHSEHYWGYSIEYYLSSLNKCTPSYASYFYSKHMLSINDLAKLLSEIDEDKKNSFDKDYAEKLYLKFNKTNDFDDSITIKNLRKTFENKEVLIIAPGKSIISFKKNILDFIKLKKIITISLNMIDQFSTNFTFITRGALLNEIDKTESEFIIPSNIKIEESDKIHKINYANWILKDATEIHDSSSVLCLNLLKFFKVKKIYLAGFDGFTSSASDNYYNINLRNAIDKDLALKRNTFYENYFKELKKTIKIIFITPTIYDKQN